MKITYEFHKSDIDCEEIEQVIAKIKAEKTNFFYTLNHKIKQTKGKVLVNITVNASIGKFCETDERREELAVLNRIHNAIGESVIC